MATRRRELYSEEHTRLMHVISMLQTPSSSSSSFSSVSVGSNQGGGGAAAAAASGWDPVRWGEALDSLTGYMEGDASLCTPLIKQTPAVAALVDVLCRCAMQRHLPLMVVPNAASNTQGTTGSGGEKGGGASGAGNNTTTTPGGGAAAAGVCHWVPNGEALEVCIKALKLLEILSVETQSTKAYAPLMKPEKMKVLLELALLGTLIPPWSVSYVLPQPQPPAGGGDVSASAAAAGGSTNGFTDPNQHQHDARSQRAANVAFTAFVSAATSLRLPLCGLLVQMFTGIEGDTARSVAATIGLPAVMLNLLLATSQPSSSSSSVGRLLPAGPAPTPGAVEENVFVVSLCQVIAVMCNWTQRKKQDDVQGYMGPLLDLIVLHVMRSTMPREIGNDAATTAGEESSGSRWTCPTLDVFLSQCMQGHHTPTAICALLNIATLWCCAHPPNADCLVSTEPRLNLLRFLLSVSSAHLTSSSSTSSAADEDAGEEEEEEGSSGVQQQGATVGVPPSGRSLQSYRNEAVMLQGSALVFLVTCSSATSIASIHAPHIAGGGSSLLRTAAHASGSGGMSNMGRLACDPMFFAETFPHHVMSYVAATAAAATAAASASGGSGSSPHQGHQQQQQVDVGKWIHQYHPLLCAELSNIRELVMALPVQLAIIRREHYKVEVVRESLVLIEQLVRRAAWGGGGGTGAASPSTGGGPSKAGGTATREQQPPQGPSKDYSNLVRFILSTSFGCLKTLFIPLASVDEALSISVCHLLTFICDGNPSAVRFLVASGILSTLLDILGDYNEDVLQSAISLLTTCVCVNTRSQQQQQDAGSSGEGGEPGSAGGGSSSGNGGAGGGAGTPAPWETAAVGYTSAIGGGGGILGGFLLESPAAVSAMVGRGIVEKGVFARLAHLLMTQVASKLTVPAFASPQRMSGGTNAIGGGGGALTRQSSTSSVDTLLGTTAGGNNPRYSSGGGGGGGVGTADCSLIDAQTVSNSENIMPAQPAGGSGSGGTLTMTPSAGTTVATEPFPSGTVAAATTAAASTAPTVIVLDAAQLLKLHQCQQSMIQCASRPSFLAFARSLLEFFIVAPVDDPFSTGLVNAKEVVESLMWMLETCCGSGVGCTDIGGGMLAAATAGNSAPSSSSSSFASSSTATTTASSMGPGSYSSPTMGASGLVGSGAVATANTTTTTPVPCLTWWLGPLIPYVAQALTMSMKRHHQCNAGALRIASVQVLKQISWTFSSWGTTGRPLCCVGTVEVLRRVAAGSRRGSVPPGTALGGGMGSSTSNTIAGGMSTFRTATGSDSVGGGSPAGFYSVASPMIPSPTQQQHTQPQQTHPQGGGYATAQQPSEAAMESIMFASSQVTSTSVVSLLKLAALCMQVCERPHTSTHQVGGGRQNDAKLVAMTPQLGVVPAPAATTENNAVGGGAGGGGRTWVLVEGRTLVESIAGLLNLSPWVQVQQLLPQHAATSQAHPGGADVPAGATTQPRQLPLPQASDERAEAWGVLTALATHSVMAQKIIVANRHIVQRFWSTILDAVPKLNHAVVMSETAALGTPAVGGPSANAGGGLSTPTMPPSGTSTATGGNGGGGGGSGNGTPIIAASPTMSYAKQLEQVCQELRRLLHLSAHILPFLFPAFQVTSSVDGGSPAKVALPIHPYHLQQQGHDAQHNNNTVMATVGGGGGAAANNSSDSWEHSFDGNMLFLRRYLETVAIISSHPGSTISLRVAAVDSLQRAATCGLLADRPVTSPPTPSYGPSTTTPRHHTSSSGHHQHASGGASPQASQPQAAAPPSVLHHQDTPDAAMYPGGGQRGTSPPSTHAGSIIVHHLFAVLILCEELTGAEDATMLANRAFKLMLMTTGSTMDTICAMTSEVLALHRLFTSKQQHQQQQLPFVAPAWTPSDLPLQQQQHQPHDGGVVATGPPGAWPQESVTDEMHPESQHRSGVGFGKRRTTPPPPALMMPTDTPGASSLPHGGLTGAATNATLAQTIAAQWKWYPLQPPEDADDTHDLMVSLLPIFNGLMHYDQRCCDAAFVSCAWKPLLEVLAIGEDDLDDETEARGGPAAANEPVKYLIQIAPPAGIPGLEHHGPIILQRHRKDCGRLELGLKALSIFSIGNLLNHCTVPSSILPMIAPVPAALLPPVLQQLRAWIHHQQEQHQQHGGGGVHPVMGLPTVLSYQPVMTRLIDACLIFLISAKLGSFKIEEQLRLQQQQHYQAQCGGGSGAVGAGSYVAKAVWPPSPVVAFAPMMEPIVRQLEFDMMTERTAFQFCFPHLQPPPPPAATHGGGGESEQQPADVDEEDTPLPQSEALFDSEETTYFLLERLVLLCRTTKTSYKRLYLAYQGLLLVWICMESVRIPAAASLLMSLLQEEAEVETFWVQFESRWGQSVQQAVEAQRVWLQQSSLPHQQQQPSSGSSSGAKKMIATCFDVQPEWTWRLPVPPLGSMLEVLKRTLTALSTQGSDDVKMQARSYLSRWAA